MTARNCQIATDFASRELDNSRVIDDDDFANSIQDSNAFPSKFVFYFLGEFPRRIGSKTSSAPDILTS